MMPFKQFLQEKIDLSDVLIDARQIIENIIITVSNNLVSRSEAKFDPKDDDEYNSFTDKVITDIKQTLTQEFVNFSYIDNIIRQLEDNLTQHVEKKFGKIVQPTVNDKGEVEKNHLYTIGHILISIHTDDESSAGGWFSYHPGHFASLPWNVAKDTTLHDRATAHARNNENSVGITVICNLNDFRRAVNTEIVDSISNNGEFRLYEIEKNGPLDQIITRLLSTYSHEVEHLYQYIGTQLTGKHDYRFPTKSYLPKDVKQTTDKIIWDTGMDLNYYATNIEIDAHAMSVASKIIQQSMEYDSGYRRRTDPQKVNYARTWDNLNAALWNVKEGWIYDTSWTSYAKMKANMNDHPVLLKIWKRFIKKVYEKIDNYATKMRAGMEAERKEELQREREWKKQWNS